MGRLCGRPVTLQCHTELIELHATPCARSDLRPENIIMTGVFVACPPQLPHHVFPGPQLGVPYQQQGCGHHTTAQHLWQCKARVPLVSLCSAWPMETDVVALGSSVAQRTPMSSSLCFQIKAFISSLLHGTRESTEQQSNRATSLTVSAAASMSAFGMVASRQHVGVTCAAIALCLPRRGNGNFFANLTKIYSLTSPVSGVIPVNFADVTPINITQMVLTVDPLFGAAGPSYGLLLASGSRFTNKTLCPKYGTCQGTVSLDTTQLCNGVHRLVSRSDSFVASPPALANYGAGTFSVSNMATIKVQNPSQPASCAAVKDMAAVANGVGVRSFGSRLGTRSAWAAARRAARAARAAPEMAVMAAQPRIVQELEVVAVSDAALTEP